jgi:hypothetical protein
LYAQPEGELEAREQGLGLKMADLFTLPAPVGRLMKWMMRQRQVSLADVAGFLDHSIALFPPDSLRWISSDTPLFYAEIPHTWAANLAETGPRARASFMSQPRYPTVEHAWVAHVCSSAGLSPS